MNKKLLLAISLIITIIIIGSCGGGSSSSQPGKKSSAKVNTSDYDPNRGEGKFDETNVQAGPLNIDMAKRGKAIASTKCNSCHKMTPEKLVGPGLKDVTKRRSLHWLMNFITNPEPMIDKDPELQAQLEICLVRMPNQNLTEDDARNIVEYLRQNDGVK